MWSEVQQEKGHLDAKQTTCTMPEHKLETVVIATDDPKLVTMETDHRPLTVAMPTQTDYEPVAMGMPSDDAVAMATPNNDVVATPTYDDKLITMELGHHSGTVVMPTQTKPVTVAMGTHNDHVVAMPTRTNSQEVAMPTEEDDEEYDEDRTMISGLGANLSCILQFICSLTNYFI